MTRPRGTAKVPRLSYVKAFMRIYLHEIKETESELDFNQEQPWVQEAVSRVDELEVGKRAPDRIVDVHFDVRKVDGVVVVSGKVRTEVQLLCSRCGNPFRLPCDTKFSSLFCNDPAMAGVGHIDEIEGKPAGQNKGFARHAPSSSDPGYDESKDLDITYLSEDFIDLGDIVTEQLQLRIPFQPLCRESCKGICTHCGADLNVGRCACAKINKTSPFSVLRNLKIDLRG